ncbi:competence protein CoiA [Vagococcus vulneris]|uniref:Competence protein CoiA n=1 Tax=Vagococcus vulneris TaxID=1977869 RepID=A0A429ZVA9_9ENTE|nr:competence protein CoiA family protein [Vagococcus vulneris]RST97659.1 hypothetical protein CBF37_09300 [Vagococcus vulneris]
MLVGQDEQGTIIDLSQLTKKAIADLKARKWYCCHCKTELVVKNGNFKLSHFAHRSTALCDAFTDNESEEHLKGKKLIAVNCQKFGTAYQLEAYLPSLKQRPDILLRAKLAIEWQCSRLSVERMHERTTNYIENEYIPIWLLGHKLMTSKKTIRLTQLQRKFVDFSASWGCFLLGLDLEKKQLIRHHHIVFYEGKLSFAEDIRRLSSLPLEKLLIEDSQQVASTTCMSPKEKESYFLRQSYQWNQRLTRKEPTIMALQQFFYPHQINLRQPPKWLLVPRLTHCLFEEKELVIRYKILACLSHLAQATTQELTAYLMADNWLINELAQYPLIRSEEMLTPVVENYLQALIQYGYRKIYYTGRYWKYQRQKV